VFAVIVSAGTTDRVTEKDVIMLFVIQGVHDGVEFIIFLLDVPGSKF
jgi:hypothetical protein